MSRGCFQLKEDEDYLMVTLYGEGYGDRIQKNGDKYLGRKNVGFILFDVHICGKDNLRGWWLKRDAIEDIAKKLDIPVVPVIGILPESDIIYLVKRETKSIVAIEDRVFEGVVCREPNGLLMRNGERLMFKLKVEDYRKLGDGL